ncbi:MAG: nucleotide exchange factor GrpE [Theionarchaea archaeon]|nr:MAG: hypothetical protein AYK19_03150 [Theionarchaea archaeon DG-70-1]MBU7025465.1 nucleotide exchange factor GrpE [Theionarchaea archaeon]
MKKAEDQPNPHSQPKADAELVSPETGYTNLEFSEEPPEQLVKRIQKLQREVQEKEEKAEDYVLMLQRLQAEFENYKKRAERERIEYTEQANAQLVLGLLPVLDNFERALQAEGSNGDSLKKGMKMVFSQLSTILEKEGLSPIKAVGELFDPYYHEAVLTAEGDYDEDTVIEEFEKGYLFRNKVLRPSKVKVGKRGD